jgi:hypothetical protein
MTEVCDALIALKEWAVHIRAMAAGEQFIVLRKGGIREETKHFSVQSKRFLLFPTYEHQKLPLIRMEYQHWLEQSVREFEQMGNQIPVQYAAEVVAERLIHDDSQLTSLASYHIGTPTFASERLHWKKQQPLHALALRVYRLPMPILLENSPDFAGCKSWLELPVIDFAWSALEPVVDDEQFSSFLQKFLAES